MTTPGKIRAWLQLVRLPNLFTSAADVLAAAICAGANWSEFWIVARLCAASIFFYAAGVTLNDAFDAKRDFDERSDRPIPSGSVSRETAFLVGLGLILLGVVTCAWHAVAMGAQDFTVPVVGILLAGFILLYDGILKRTVWAPGVMGGCRGLNWMLGLAALGAVDWGLAGFCVGVVWVYVTALTVFARTEARASSGGRLLAGVIGVVGAVLAAASAGVVAGTDVWGAVGGAGLAIGLGRLGFRAVRTGAPEDVQRAVKWFVLGLVGLDAVLVATFAGSASALLVLSLLAPAIVAARLIRVT